MASGKEVPDPTDYLGTYKGVIDRYMQSIHSREDDVSIASAEAISAGGKRIRPIVTLLVCEAVSGNYEKALPVASAYELAHGASLVQDDIIDESDTRHGRQAPHKRYGLLKAILISDSLLFDIFMELSKYDAVQISKGSLSELLSLVGNAAKMAARGEFYEASLAAKGLASEEEYLKLAELKTGALFAGAAASGAVVGGAKKPVVDAMYRFGLTMGVSFQIQDDILDIAGDSRSTGKPVLKDIQHNATNLILVHALSKADPYQKQIIESMLWRKWFTTSDVERLTLTLDELGSLDHAGQVAHHYAEDARRTLRLLPQSVARDRLEGLTHGLEVRRK